jgi:hypothetical protein
MSRLRPVGAQLASFAALVLSAGTLGCGDDSPSSKPKRASTFEDAGGADDGSSAGQVDGAAFDGATTDASAFSDGGEAYVAMQTLLAAKSCGTFGCHATGSGSFSLLGRAWIELDFMNRPVNRLAEWAVGQDAEPCARPARTPMKRVAPGFPENSYLVHVLRGTKSCGDGVRMPPDGPYLEEHEIRIVERWIRELRR